MCYSASASLRSYLATNALLVLLVLVYGITNLYLVWHVTFVATFSLIQLVEYYIWCSLYSDDKVANRYWTVLIPPLLWLQPLVQTIGYFSTLDQYDSCAVFVALSSILFYTTSTILSFVQRNHRKEISQVGPNGHLVWSQENIHSLPQALLYLLGMFIPLLAAKEYLLFIYGALSLVYSRVVYPVQEFSSMWCFIAIGYTLSVVIQMSLGHLLIW